MIEASLCFPFFGDYCTSCFWFLLPFYLTILSAGLVLGCIVTYLLSRINQKVPYTVIVFIIGMCLAFGVENSDFLILGESINQWISFEPRILLYIFLPPLIFGDAMQLNIHHLKCTFYSSILLAGPGSLVGMFLLGACCRVMLPYNWSWDLCFTFGAILCATDPVAVVSLLKRVGAAPRLSILVIQEALYNDGAALVLFNLYFSKLSVNVNSTADDVGSAILYFVRVVFISPLLGGALGLCTVIGLRLANRRFSPEDVTIQIALTVCLAYLSFFLAESVVGVSGVLSCCAAGIVISWFGSPLILEQQAMHSVWDTLEWMGNTLIFLLSGLLIVDGCTRYPLTVIDLLLIVLVYLLLQVIRALILLASYPMISSWGLGVSARECVFMSWAGLRGAVGTVLGLVLLHGAMRGDLTISAEDGHWAFVLVGGASALTLLVNATLAQYVLYKLGLANASTKETVIMQHYVRKRIHKRVREAVTDLKKQLPAYDDFLVAEFSKVIVANSLYTNENQTLYPLTSPAPAALPSPTTTPRLSSPLVHTIQIRNAHMSDQGMPSRDLGSAAPSLRLRPVCSPSPSGKHSSGAALDSNDVENPLFSSASTVEARHDSVPGPVHCPASLLVAAVGGGKDSTESLAATKLSTPERVSVGWHEPEQDPEADVSNNNSNNGVQGRVAQDQRASRAQARDEDSHGSAQQQRRRAFSLECDAFSSPGKHSPQEILSPIHLSVNSRMSGEPHRPKFDSKLSLHCEESYSGYNSEDASPRLRHRGFSECLEAGVTYPSLSLRNLQEHDRSLKWSSPVSPAISAQSGITHSQTSINMRLLVHVREAFLEVVRAVYWKHIEEGKLPRNSASALALLYSVDVGLDTINTPGLQDWDALQPHLELSSYKWLEYVAYSLDVVVYCVVYAIWFLSTLLRASSPMDESSEVPAGAQPTTAPAAVPSIEPGARPTNRAPQPSLQSNAVLSRYLSRFLDTWRQERSVYILSSFVEAHEQAQLKVPTFLGEEEGVDTPELALVVEESRESVGKAKLLLEQIDADVVSYNVSKQVARILLHLQQDMLETFQEEGVLRPRDAELLLVETRRDCSRLELEWLSRNWNKSGVRSLAAATGRMEEPEGSQ